MLVSLLKADFKRVGSMHLIVLCMGFGLITGLIYLVSPDASWIGVGAPGGESGYGGFLPHAVAVPEFSEGGFSLGDAVASAAVAHTVFFPIFALVTIYLFFFRDISGGIVQVSLARGISLKKLFLSKLLTITVLMLVYYIVISVILGCLYAFVLCPASAGYTMEAVAEKIVLNSLVNESYLVFCVAVFSWMRNGPVAMGVVLVATLVGLVTQASMPALTLPVHMGFWIKASGLVVFGNWVWSLVIFSIVSVVLLIPIAYRGIVGLRK